MFSRHLPDSPIRLPNREAWFVNPTAPDSEFSGCFTPLNLMLDIVLGVVRLACSFSAMKKHSMRLHLHNCVLLMPVKICNSSARISRVLANVLHLWRSTTVLCRDKDLEKADNIYLVRLGQTKKWGEKGLGKKGDQELDDGRWINMKDNHHCIAPNIWSLW